MEINPTIAFRTAILYFFTCVALLAQIFLSWPLWGGIADFPTVNIGGVGAFLFTLSGGLVGSLGCFLCLANWPPIRRFALLLVVLLLVALCLGDLNRLQVWVYFYTCIFVVYLVSDTTVKVEHSLKWVFAMVYFWSGAQKLNIQFSEHVYPWLMKLFEGTAWLADIPLGGYGIGLLELIMGLGLCFRITARGALFGLLFMHLFILCFLIKDGWNTVVYPWNIYMPIALFSLFFRQQEGLVLKHVFKPFIPLFGIAPLLLWVGLWPYNFSFSMYSGLGPDAYITVSDRTQGCLPKAVDEAIDKRSLLLVDDWSQAAFNAPVFPSLYVYKQIGAAYCACIDTTSQANTTLLFSRPKRWQDTTVLLYFSCEELSK